MRVVLSTVNLDFSKPSDKVLHDVIMYKIERKGLSERTIKSISHWLNGYTPNKLLKSPILSSFTDEEINTGK